MRNFGVVAALLLCGCLAEDQYQTMVKNAAVCTEADTCVVTDLLPNSCTCSEVVRKNAAPDIENAAKRVSCGGQAVARCGSWVNPRCEAGVCVADAGT